MSKTKKRQKKNKVKRETIGKKEVEIVNGDVDLMSLVPLGANSTQVPGGNTVLLMKAHNAPAGELKPEQERELNMEHVKKKLTSLEKELAKTKAALDKATKNKDEEEEEDEETDVETNPKKDKEEDTPTLAQSLATAHETIGRLKVQHESELKDKDAKIAELEADKQELQEIVEEIDRNQREAAGESEDDNPDEPDTDNEDEEDKEDE